MSSPFDELERLGRGYFSLSTTPRVVVEAAFVEWTDEGVLRHAVFVGVRADRAARDVRRDT